VVSVVKKTTIKQSPNSDDLEREEEEEEEEEDYLTPAPGPKINYRVFKM
jgi:hypothetical protein